jgi:hypothetical protein
MIRKKLISLNLHMLGTKWRGHNSYDNFTNRKSMDGNQAQVVELLPGKQKTQSLNHSTIKKERNKKKSTLFYLLLYFSLIHIEIFLVLILLLLYFSY